MKKSFVVIVLLIGLFLMGCSSGNSSSTGEENEKESKVNNQKVITIESGEPIFADDPSTFEGLFIENHTIVVEAEVEEKLESKYLPRSVKLNLLDPVTPVTLRDVKILYGDERKINEIFTNGGQITAEEYIENNTDGSVQKMELNNLSDEEKKQTYLYFEGDEKDIQEGEIYILVLYEQEEGSLILADGGYGTFKKKGDVFINVKTGKPFEEFFTTPTK